MFDAPIYYSQGVGSSFARWIRCASSDDKRDPGPVEML